MTAAGGRRAAAHRIRRTGRLVRRPIRADRQPAPAALALTFPGAVSHPGCVAIFRVRRSRRIAVVDDYRFPSGVRQRLAQRHTALTGDDLQSVEAATRQWFRLCARHPRAGLAMPSVIVDDLWRELVLHEREYAEFCGRAFGRLLPPGSVDRPGALGDTFRFARQDEPAGPGVLPLLFRVDRQLAVAGGRDYLADCGGRGTCYELKGTICLRHLDGLGKAPGGGTWNLGHTQHGGGGAPSNGCGGCGSGCGSGS